MNIIKRSYISGPLHVISNRNQARAFYDFLAQICQKCGWEAYVPHKYTDPILHNEVSPVSVFDRDYSILQNVDVIIAYIGEPSSGVGAELGIAFERGIQVIALHQKEESPSRFILGMLDKKPNARILIYRDWEHCGQLLQNELKENNSKP